jgi:hypothetical protein
MSHSTAGRYDYQTWEPPVTLQDRLAIERQHADVDGIEPMLPGEFEKAHVLARVAARVVADWKPDSEEFRSRYHRNNLPVYCEQQDHVYRSVSEAARACDMSTMSVRRSIRGVVLVCGLRFRYVVDATGKISAYARRMLKRKRKMQHE